MENKQKNVVLSGFKDAVRDQVADILQEDGLYLHDMDIVINQDAESKSFGEIESLTIKAGYLEDEGIPVSFIQIDKIIIADNKKDNDYDIANMNNLLSPEQIQIKKRLSDFYKMEQDNINISIQEDNVRN